MRSDTFLPAAASPASARSPPRWWTSGASGRVLAADVALCVSELAANAVLHTRAPYTVTVRPAGLGVRVDVIDGRPEQLPVVVPLVGTVVDLTERSTTGRGLQIVATLADRWGVSTTNGAKAVWVELSGQAHEGPSAPTIVIGHEPAPAAGHAHAVPRPPGAGRGGERHPDRRGGPRGAARGAGRAHRPAPPRARLLELLDESAPAAAGRSLRGAAGPPPRTASASTSRWSSPTSRLAAVGELAELLRAGSTPPPAPAARGRGVPPVARRGDRLRSGAATIPDRARCRHEHARPTRGRGGAAQTWAFALAFVGLLAGNAYVALAGRQERHRRTPDPARRPTTRSPGSSPSAAASRSSALLVPC